MRTPVNSPAQMLLSIHHSFAKLCSGNNEVEMLIIPIHCIAGVDELRRLLSVLHFYTAPCEDVNSQTDGQFKSIGTFTTTAGANHEGSYSLYHIEVDYKLPQAKERQLYLIAIRDSGMPAESGRTPPDVDAFSQHIGDMKARAEDFAENRAKPEDWLDIGGIFTGRDLLKFADFPAYLGHLATSDAYMVYRCDFGLSLDY